MTQDRLLERTPLDTPWYPQHLVVGAFQKPIDLERASKDLKAEGIREDRLYRMQGEEARRRMDLEGRSMSFPKRLFRGFWKLISIESMRLRELDDTSRDAPYVIAVQAEEQPQALLAAKVLHLHDAHEVTHFSRWETTGGAPSSAELTKAERERRA